MKSNIESSVKSINIISQNIESKNPLVIKGFPGIGLVGNIVCQHIIEELNMKYIGSIDSRYFPPIAVLFNGIVSMPVRIYESPEKEIVVVISDIPIHPTISYDVGKALVEWSVSINAKKIISIAGISTPTGQKRVFGGATDNEILETIKDKIEIFQVGTVSGISGSIMTECFIRKIPAICLLGETQGTNPDPISAINVVNVLSDVFKLNIDTTKLLNQAQQIELELSKLAEQVKSTEATTKKEFPMYG